MPETSTHVEIPKRALFKAAEVCDLVKVQPYVLRSWEAEFPDLGVAKTAGGPRVYRRADVEQVLRIKHLLLVEGLTLAGARRRLVEEETPVAADAPVLDELIGQNARERLTEVKRGLRAILDLLAGRHNGDDFQLAPPPVAPRHRAVARGAGQVGAREGGRAPRRLAARGARRAASVPRDVRCSVRLRAGPSKSRDVAQPGSAPDWGSGGRGFESRHPDQFFSPISGLFCRDGGSAPMSGGSAAISFSRRDLPAVAPAAR